MRDPELLIPVKIGLHRDSVCNAFVGAIEGGYSPWLGGVTLVKSSTEPKKGLVWYGQEELYDKDLQFRVRYDREEDDEGTFKGVKTFTWSNIVMALTFMAEKHTRHFIDMVNENDDAITHDVFMQCLVFDGEVIYG